MPISREIENKINEHRNDLEVVYNTFKNLDTRISELNKKLSLKEAEQNDLLHEVELANLNVVERSRFYNELKKVREERREIKDELQICNTLKPLADMVIKKGVYAEINQTVKNLENCKTNFKERKYNPKVRKDLKCTKNTEL